MLTEDDIHAPVAATPSRTPRRFGGRKIAMLVAAVVAAGAAWAALDYHRSCACQVPPVLNMIAFHYAAKQAAAGDYARAREVFETLVSDPNSAAYRSVALYGRGVSRRALGDVGGGDADIGAAIKLEPRAATLYASFLPTTR